MLHVSNRNKIYDIKNNVGRAIVQVVSRWLPSAEAGISSCGICGGQSGAGAGFLRVYLFPLLICIPPVSAQSLSSIICGWYNRPVVAAVPSELSLISLTMIVEKNSVNFLLRGI
jgi:hypothetical protein